jgi:copper(I)-binding protein
MCTRHCDGSAACGSRVGFGRVRAVALAGAICWSAVAVAQVAVTDAWVRGTVPGQTSTAAYVTLKSDRDLRLISVTSTAADRCSIHDMTMSGNVMRMRTLEWLAVPAGRAVELQEGREHLMLEGLRHPLSEGDAVTLTLTFVDPAGGKRLAIEVRAPVRPLGAAGELHHTMPMRR